VFVFTKMRRGAPGGGQWQVEAGLYRNSLNAMLSRQELNVTEAMMKEKTMGQASMMGPEWEPAGVISRKIAQLLEDRKNPLPVSEVRGGAMSSLASAGQAMMGPQPGMERQSDFRGPAAVGRSSPIMQLDSQRHQIEWQAMTRVGPAGAGPSGLTPMASSSSAAALPSVAPMPQLPKVASAADLERRTELPASRAAYIADKAFPKRMALGKPGSGTQGWYPGLEYTAKLGTLGKQQRGS